MYRSDAKSRRGYDKGQIVNGIRKSEFVKEGEVLLKS